MISDSPFKHDVLVNQPLARYTAARLGGGADYLHIATDPEFFDTLDVLKTAWQNNIPVTIIGGGANVLVSDKGIRGLTIINRITELDHGEWENGSTVSATSGTNLIRLTRYCQQYGYTGMEWAVGVPGTVGGAVVNNAGAHGSDISKSLVEVVVYEPKVGARLYTVDDLEYDYRYSKLKLREDRRFMVLMATFKLDKDDPDNIQKRMDEYNTYRKRTQPPGASLGSIFKNPPGDFAGRLIESAGLKGFQIGGVQVSTVHANFFVNTGRDATATDYFKLIQYVQRVVCEKFGIELELEIQTLGDWK